MLQRTLSNATLLVMQLYLHDDNSTTSTITPTNTSSTSSTFDPTNTSTMTSSSTSSTINPNTTSTSTSTTITSTIIPTNTTSTSSSSSPSSTTTTTTTTLPPTTWTSTTLPPEPEYHQLLTAKRFMLLIVFVLLCYYIALYIAAMAVGESTQPFLQPFILARNVCVGFVHGVQNTVRRFRHGSNVQTIDTTADSHASNVNIFNLNEEDEALTHHTRQGIAYSSINQPAPGAL